MTSPLTILERTFAPIAAPALRVRRTLPFSCGVYLLVEATEIVYVGSSTDLVSRLYQHALDRRGTRPNHAKRWDRACWLALPAKVHRHYEGALIRALRPRYNRHAPRSCGFDNEILDGLGLPIHADEAAVARAWLDVRRDRVVSWRYPRGEGQTL